MKKLLSLLLIPVISYALSPDQFTETTKKGFQEKFDRVQSRLSKEGIDSKRGIAKIYSQLLGTSIEDVFKNKKAMKIANQFFTAIEHDDEYESLVQQIKNAKTEDAFEQASYEYMKFVYEKSVEIAGHYCSGLEIPQENRNRPNDREWMMIDYPEYFRLNQDKEFDPHKTEYVYKYKNVVWQNWNDRNYRTIIEKNAKDGWRLVQILTILDSSDSYSSTDRRPRCSDLIFEKSILVKKEDCKNCILGVNAVTSLMMQKMYELREEN